MAQDIRDLLKGYDPSAPKLRKGHESRFEDKLANAFPEEKKGNPSFFWLKIAATVVMVLSIGYFGFQSLSKDEIVDNGIVETTDGSNETQGITLGDLSPDLKKVEEFYVTGINLQLSSLTKSPENEELVNGYLTQLEALNKAYAILNTELNEVGPSEATITALIDNLKLRLELLFKLKNKLKELKQLENENYSNSTV
jgi:hypothetical protein